jgi:hypothetical protein
MNTFCYITGIVSAIIILLGSIFKINHFPGAAIMLITGISILVMIFMPVAIIRNYKNVQHKLSLHISLFLTGFFVFVSALFKILHWPHAGDLLIVGILIPAFLFLPVYMYFNIKEKKRSYKDYIGVIFFLLYYSVSAALLALPAGG